MAHTPPLLSKVQDGSHSPPPPLLSQHRASITQALNAHASQTGGGSSSPPPLPPPLPSSITNGYGSTTNTDPVTPSLNHDTSVKTRLNSSNNSSGGDTSIDINNSASPIELDDLETQPLAVLEAVHADTQERRASQIAIQNSIAWKRAQSLMTHDGEDPDADDLTPLFANVPANAPTSPTNEVKMLRPSSAQVAASSSSPPIGEGEWDTTKTRVASASQSFLSAHEQSLMLQLPKEFKGAAKLTMPAYLTGPISNVTLPSRLDLLGRRGFKLLGSFNPRRVGNAVLGWSPVITTSWKTRELKLKMQLFVLPSVFSKSMAKILLFLRFVFLALVVIFIIDVSGAVSTNPGRVWAIGIFLALIVMYQQSRYRRAPDGVMAFCRSMGVPEVEEYMFSYCWKVEPENVRTLAKAVWKAGVGVWIDVVKLCPGDEIRPMVRTTVRRVHKVIVFLCDEYCQSPNCCVEMMEAVQHPEKVTICIIKNNIHPNIMRFLINLKSRGLRMCVGFDEIMSILDMDLQDMSDIAAFQWWRSQNISGAGVPDNLVPSNWPMSRFSIRGRMWLPEKSVDVGPVYISGDCKETGQSLALPWLLFIATLGVAINVYDMIDKYRNSALLHSTIDWVFLGVIAACNCAPFIGFSYLLDRRRDCHVSLRPLLASRSMGKDGIKVRVIGDPEDPIYIALRKFLSDLGHLAPDLALDADGQPILTTQVNGVTRKEPRCVTVYIMENLARRDAMFGPGSANKKTFDNRFSLFIWSGFKEQANLIPFTDDEIGQRLMRYLVLVVDWEKHGLCESLFSAIGVRVVDILHEKPSTPASAIGSGRTTPSMSILAGGKQSGYNGIGLAAAASPTAALPGSFPLGNNIPMVIEEEESFGTRQRKN